MAMTANSAVYVLDEFFIERVHRQGVDDVYELLDRSDESVGRCVGVGWFHC